MKNVLSTIGCFAYVIIGLVQIAATIAGFEAWWGWSGFFAIIGAVIVGHLPIFGTVMGIMGAIKGWGWSPILAILFFCWPFVIYIAAIALDGAVNVISRFKK